MFLLEQEVYIYLLLEMSLTLMSILLQTNAIKKNAFIELQQSITFV